MVVLINAQELAGLSKEQRQAAIDRTVQPLQRPRHHALDDGQAETPTAPAAAPQRPVEQVSDGDARLRQRVLPVPPPLAELLPDGGLPIGVIRYVGSAGPVLGITAAVTAAGLPVVWCGVPQLNSHAVHEMSGDLGRLYFVPDPGSEPARVVEILVEGFPLVLSGPAGMDVPPSRSRAILARARESGCSLIMAGGPRWEGTGLDIQATLTKAEGLRQGAGRVRSLSFAVRARSKAGLRVGEIAHRPGPGESVEWVRQSTQDIAPVLEREASGA